MLQTTRLLPGAKLAESKNQLKVLPAVMGNSSRKELLPQDGCLVIHFLCADDVPKTEDNAYPDPCMETFLVDKTKEIILCNSIKTKVCHGTRQPIWNSFHNFKVNAPNDSFLRCILRSNDDVLGHVDVPMNEYWDESIHKFNFEFHNFGSPARNPKFSLLMRRLFMNSPPPERRLIYIIRHGESLWNKAQSEGDVGNMIRHDHCLSQVGYDQAQDLSNRCKQTFETFIPQEYIKEPLQGPFDENLLKKYYTQKFFECKRVYSSPLTRALQTCLVALRDHYAVQKNGITLYSTIREVKAVGGLDTVGLCCGGDIMVRVLKKFETMVGVEMADEYSKVAIDFNDANQPWWTSKLSYDSEKDVQDRLDEFLEFVHYNFASERSSIFVGHSMFFKALCKRQSEKLLQNRRPLAEKMRKFKMSNAAVLAITLKYTDSEGRSCDPFIEDAELLFDSTFHEK